MSEKLYYEVVGSKGNDHGPYWWKIYHYDQSGNHEIVIHRSPRRYPSAEQAEDACCEFMENEGIDAELS